MAGIDSVFTPECGGSTAGPTEVEGSVNSEGDAAASVSWDDPAPDQNMYNSIKDLQR